MTSERIVCVIEDDESVLDPLVWMLKSFGFHVVAFSCAEDFLQCGDGKQYACLLVDMCMPGMNGLELIGSLKKRDVTIPTILMRVIVIRR